MTPSRLLSLLNLLAILVVLACTAPAHPVTARQDDISELIDLINALRASHGLAPYSVDPGLMALAQEHSEYQAAIHTSTHQHSDGRDPPEIGVVENVAGGDIGYLDPQAAVYEIWADPVHGRTMIGYAAGSMGVGIADDGVTVYYTLEVRPAGRDTPNASGTGTVPLVLTPIPLTTLVPATPRSDGSIVHTVGYGQTLWAIALAYGITIDQIRAWNNLPADSNDIYAGQILLVFPASLVTPLSPTLTGPAAQPKEGVTGSPTIDLATSTITPSPPGSTPSAAVAKLPSKGIESPASKADDSPVDTGSLAPLFAGGSILIGCALLLILQFNRKKS